MPPAPEIEPWHDPSRVDELYGHVNPTADDHFAAVVRTTAPDVVHFHAFSPAVTPVTPSTTLSGMPPRAWTDWAPSRP